MKCDIVIKYCPLSQKNYVVAFRRIFKKHQTTHCLPFFDLGIFFLYLESFWGGGSGGFWFLFVLKRGSHEFQADVKVTM